MYNEIPFETLLGKTLTSVVGGVGDEEVVFTTTEGERFHLYHERDCCESVRVEDICGDMADLLLSPLLMAEVVTNRENPEGVVKKYQESFTWTFYKLATVKGYVTIRWYGESNGYYSERVTFSRY